jgi:chemotaxis signal transduction protein
MTAVSAPHTGVAVNSAPSDGRDADARLLLVVRIGAQTVALPASAVERILPMAAITPLPDAPVGVVGLLNLHGEVLLVVDPRARLSLGSPSPPQPDPSQHLVVVASRARYLLWVDQVERVVTLPPGGRRALGDQPSGALTPEVVRIDSMVVPVLSPEALAPAAVRPPAPVDQPAKVTEPVLGAE